MGLLTSASGQHQNGPVAVTLSLYNAATGGTALWSENQTVTVTNGLFSTALGSATPFPAGLDFSLAYFVGIKVGSDPEMAPRIPLQGVPYAMFAQAVANHSVTSAKLASDAASLKQVSGGAMAASNGYIGIGTLSPAATLEITKAVPGQLGPVLRLTGGGGSGAQAALDLSSYVPDSGAAPSARILASDNNYSSDLDFMTKDPGAMANGLTSRMRISSGGNVGIGTTSPADKLSVNGSADIAGNLGIGTTAPAWRLDIQDDGWPSANIKSSSTLGTWLNLGNSSIGGEYWHFISTGSSNGEGAGKLLVTPGSGPGSVGNPYGLTLDSSGNAGLGTPSPTAALDVRGDIKLGSTGQYYAVGAPDNARMIAGTVNSNGSIPAGSGFTVTKNGTGDYTISFSAPLNGILSASAIPFTTGPLVATETDFTSGHIRFKFQLPFGGSAADPDAFSFIVLGNK